MQLKCFRGTDAPRRGTSWMLVTATVTGAAMLLPCRAAPQVNALPSLSHVEWESSLEWQSTIHPQLQPQRLHLTPTQRSAVRWGGRIGGLVGLATGVILAMRHDCVEEECLVAPAAVGLTIAFGTALGMIGGMGVGLVVGSVIDGSNESQLRLALAVDVGG